MTRGNELHKKQQVTAITTLSIILLTLTFFTASYTPKVFAETSISQLSKYEGFVGDTIELTGQINITDGAYQILFDGHLVKNGTAALNVVKDTFVIPNATLGTYPITLRDVQADVVSSSVNFAVKTQYIGRATKTRLQEGENTTILAIITGGEAKTDYSANVTVKDPDNKVYSSNFTISTGPQLGYGGGYGENVTVYPTDFDANAHTFYVGTYNLTLNVGSNQSTGTFTVGLTDAVEYHRFQVVNVKAANYTQPTDVMRVTITYGGKTVFTSPNINASQTGGIVTANWPIPANASLGLYRVNVTRTTPSGTMKPVQDTQTFTIVSKSFACEVRALNLDNEPVKGIVVEAKNATASVSTNTTDEEGIASFYVQATNYTFTAFLNDSRVGATSIISLSGNLTGAQALNITCSLVHLRVAVKDEGGNVIPYVAVNANFTYIKGTNTTANGTSSIETDLSGIATLRNLFVNIDYTVKASRYGNTFQTVTVNLTQTRWLNFTCPTYELVVRVFDRRGLSLQNAQVNVTDWGLGAMSEPVGSQNTAISGEVAFSLTFGKYIVKVYKNGFLLNETSVLLVNQPTNFSVYCRLFNLTLDISVLDYFGQGISNAKVTVEREGFVLSKNTGGNGVVQFTELVGGNYRIFVHIGERLYQITMLNLQDPQAVTLRIGEVVSIGGFITETSLFATATFIILLVVVLLLVFLYRRLKSSQKKE